MRTLLTSLILLFSACSFCYGQADYIKAMDDAKKTDQKVLVLFTAKWCPYCKTLEKVLKDNTKELKDYSILYYDVDTKGGKNLFKQVQKNAQTGSQIPVLVLIDPKKDKILKHIIGGISKQELLEWLK